MQIAKSFELYHSLYLIDSSSNDEWKGKINDTAINFSEIMVEISRAFHQVDKTERVERIIFSHFDTRSLKDCSSFIGL